MGTGVRFVVFIIIYMIYILGYTCQCVVTKSAQTCLTNDPKQRPIFAMCDTVYNIVLMNVIFPIVVTDTLVPKFTLTAEANAAEIASLVAQNPNLAGIVEKSGGSLSAFYNPAMFTTMQLMFGTVSAVFAVCAIIALWRKDNSKYFGLGTTQKVGVKDYVDTLAHNRAIQMLVVSASTDKLGSSAKSSAVMVAMFACIAGSNLLQSNVTGLVTIPSTIVCFLFISFFATRLGQRKAMLIGSVGGLITNGILAALWLFGDPTTMTSNPETGALNWGYFLIIYLVFTIITAGFQGISGNIVIPMTADCADYEVYRTGKYVPGLMGTLFSFVDKLVSSLAATLVALFYSMAGFKDALPDTMTPYSDGIFWATIGCFVLLPIVGWLCNVVAMHFYPLTKEKMAEIQAEIGRIKAEAAAKQA